MPDCNYCAESFADEEAYLDHLKSDHDESELSRIDRRRAYGDEDDGGGLEPGPVILGGLLLFTFAVVVYVMLFVGGNQAAPTGEIPSGPNDAYKTPTDLRSLHGHGTIEVVIDGRALDFTRPKFQKPQEYSAFHFERGGPQWHVHARGVTLEYAMATLGIGVNETAVRYDGTVYRDSDPNTNVSVEVNGHAVTPATYVLSGVQDPANAQQGDHIEIVVRTNTSS